MVWIWIAVAKELMRDPISSSNRTRTIQRQMRLRKHHKSIRSGFVQVQLEQSHCCPVVHKPGVELTRRRRYVTMCKNVVRSLVGSASSIEISRWCLAFITIQSTFPRDCFSRTVHLVAVRQPSASHLKHHQFCLTFQAQGVNRWRQEY
jgi:hypothetical protein